MTSSRFADLALVLVAAGWLLCFYGVMSQLGDPSPTTPSSVIEAHRHTSIAILLVGVLCLVSSLWLSGRSYVEAMKRSLMAAVLAVAPVVAAFVSLY